MINNQFTRNIIKVFNKFIEKLLRKKLAKCIFDYMDITDCDELGYSDLQAIADNINHYLNDKLAPLFNNISSAEFNDSYGEFTIATIPIFQRYNDDKQFEITPYDLIDIINNDSQFQRFTVYLSDLIW